MEKPIRDATKAGVRVADAAVKRAWSILEVASEKKAPSEYLSNNAIVSIQGISEPGNK